MSDVEEAAATMRRIHAEVRAMLRELHAAFNPNESIVFSSSPRGVVTELLDRGAKLLADERARMRCSMDPPAGGAREEFLRECERTRSQMKEDHFQLTEHKAALNASISMLSQGQKNEHVIGALTHLRNGTTELMARLRKLGPAMRALERVLNVHNPAMHDTETNLLNRARAIISLAAEVERAEARRVAHASPGACAVVEGALLDELAETLAPTAGEGGGSGFTPSSATPHAAGSHSAAASDAPRADGEDDDDAMRELCASFNSSMGSCASAAAAGKSAMETSLFCTEAGGVPIVRALQAAAHELRLVGDAARAGQRWEPVVQIARCESAAQLLAACALGSLPLCFDRGVEDYAAEDGTAFEPPPHGTVSLDAELDGVLRVLKPFDATAGGMRALLREASTRRLLGDSACAHVEGVFVEDGGVVWLESRKYARGSLADVLASGSRLCPSWARDAAAWRTLEAFRGLLTAIARAHENGIALGGALAPEHVLVDDSSGRLLLTSLWRARPLAPHDARDPSSGMRAQAASAAPCCARWSAPTTAAAAAEDGVAGAEAGAKLVGDDPGAADAPVSAAEDMHAFGACLYGALLGTPPPDHPHKLEAGLARTPDGAVRRLLRSLLHPEPAQRPTAYAALTSDGLALVAEHMRRSALVTGTQQRVEVFTAHAQCLAQLSARSSPMRILANRTTIVPDVLNAFFALQSTDELIKPMMVRFVGAETVAIDQGGLTRELFTAFFEQVAADAHAREPHRLLDVVEQPPPADGAGACAEEGWSEPAFLPAAGASRTQCEALGRVLLKLLLLELPCPIRLAPSLIKALSCADETLTIDDLAAFDAQAARSLRVVERATEAELREMCLCFPNPADADAGGAAQPAEPVYVNARNRQAFIAAQLDQLLERCRCVQVERVVYGFRAVPPLDAHLDMLGASGIERMLCGAPSQRPRRVRAADVVGSLVWEGWPEASCAPAHLVELLHALDERLLRKFLRLATGQSVMPAGGFAPAITVLRLPPSDALPVGSTCFHVIRLPEYGTREVLSAKLILALENVGGHDLGYA